MSLQRLRSIGERLSRGWVVKRAMPLVFGSAPIYVSADAGLRFLFRRMDDIDPPLLRIAGEYVHSGNVVWDIGANTGLFTFASAWRSGPTGKVVAVEPDTWLVGLLRRSSHEQPVNSAPVEVISSAVGEAVDLRRFKIAGRSRATNHLEGYGSTQTGGVRQCQTVVTISLDWLAERQPAPDILKVDVEGAEYEVLKGGMSLLRHARPIIVCEVTNAETFSQTHDLLHSFDYRFYDADYAEGGSAPKVVKVK